MARNLTLFLAVLLIALAGQQAVASGLGHGRGDLSWALGSIGYGLIVAGVPALVFLVPGLLFLKVAEGRLPRALLHLVAALVSALAFAPFLVITSGDVDVIALAVGALAYAVVLRLPRGALRATAA